MDGRSYGWSKNNNFRLIKSEGLGSLYGMTMGLSAGRKVGPSYGDILGSLDDNMIFGTLDSRIHDSSDGKILGMLDRRSDSSSNDNILGAFVKVKRCFVS